GPEGVETHDQLHRGQTDVPSPAPVEYAVAEVKAGRGRGHRPGRAGVHRLVALGVEEGPGDVGREGHLAQAGQLGRVGQQAHQPAAALQHLAHLDGRAVPGGQQHRARGHLLAGANQRLPAPAHGFEEEHLHHPARGLAQVEPGREDPGVVRHQEVAGLEEVRQVPHVPVLDGAVIRRHQQAGRVPRFDRLLGRGGKRQRVVEGLHAHKQDFRTPEPNPGNGVESQLQQGAKGVPLAIRADDVDLMRDRALVEQHQAGDAAAFEDLYRRYYGRLFRYCLKRVGDRHEAEELTQEAFTRAYRAMPALRGERRFYPWLSVIASRLCVDTHRRLGRTEPTAEIDAGAVDDGGERRVEAAADRALLGEALRRLSPRHREVLELREQHGWSYQRIAHHYDMSLGAVEGLLFRARQALRREFLAAAGPESGLAAGVPVIGWLVRRLHAARFRLDEAAAGWAGLPALAG